MFDIGAAELLVIVVIAILVIGPKDMPLAMRTAGRWIGKVRRVSAHFRTGLDAMVREAELEDMEKKWQAQNEEIMKRSAASTESETGEPVMTGPPPVAAEDRVASKPSGGTDDAAAPELPLPKSDTKAEPAKPAGKPSAAKKG